MKPFLFQNYEGVLIDDFVPELKEYDRIWQDGKISLDKQLKAVDFAKDHPVFFIGHRMSQDAPFHSHSFYEIVCVLNGLVENCTEKSTFYMGSGDICIMNLASSHSLKVVDPQAIVFNIGIEATEMESGTFKNLYRSATFLGNFLREKEDLDYLYFPSNGSLRLAQLIQTMLTTHARKSAGVPFLLASEVMQLLGELVDLNEYSYWGVNNRVMELLDYVEKHYATVSLAELAQEFNYSESYLSRFVKKQTGQQISRIIMGKKMEKAGLLLQNTDLSVNEIALEVGYQSYSHFHKVFKKWYRQTPNDYRQHYSPGIATR